MKHYIQNIEDALLGIPEKFRLEKNTIKANVSALIKEMEKDRAPNDALSNPTNNENTNLA